jgi:hypothetical protein
MAMLNLSGALLVLLGILLAVGVVTGKPVPPTLPSYFQGKFTEFTAPLENAPPYTNGVPSPPFTASRGTVYYDWTQSPPAMIEVREDYCVNIFPDFSPDFKCTFHNVNDISYLISNTTNMPNCCVFGDPWSPPSPDFLTTKVNSRFASHEDFDCKPADWYVIPSIPPPMGPFWYSFRNSTQSPQVYLSFSFPGVNGWVHQAFHEIAYTQPTADVWKLPEVCTSLETIPNCGFFGKENGHADKFRDSMKSIR